MGEDRIDRVKIGKYDQVVALTQHMINNGIENLWLANLKNPEMKKTFAIDLGVISGSIANVTMDAPVVQVDWAPNDQSTVLYYMHIKTGTLKVNKLPVEDTDLSSPDMASFDMAGWTLVLPVALGMKDLKTDDPVYQRKVASQPPGQYSVTRLLVSINAAKTTIDFEKSDLKGVDWKTWSETVRSRTTNLLRELLGLLFKYSLNTVGYSVASKDVEKLKKEHPATFQPVALRFQTYPWQDPDHKETASNGLTGNARLNYLLYLETCADRDGKPKPLPGPSDATLQPTGNWTSGRLDGKGNSSSTDYGALVISGANFFGGYLIPLLRGVNKAMEPSVKELKLTMYSKFPGFYYNWWSSLRVGNNEDKPSADSNFDFRPTNVPYTYEFSSKYNSDQSGMKNLWDHKDLGWYVESWGQVGCECKNTLKFTPGKPVIVLDGYSMAKLYLSVKNGPSTKDDEVTYKINWKLTMTLQGVADGGLQINCVADKPVYDISTKYEDGLLRTYETYLAASYAAAIKNLSDLEKKLAEDLSGQQKFYYPASGTFFFKDPVINAQGDLICSIGYNGNDDFRNPDTTEERKVVIPIHQPPPAPIGQGPDKSGST